MGNDSYERVFAAQHRRLDALFAELLDAVRGGSADELRDAFDRLRDALETHLDSEDRLYFPAVRALRPVHRPAIQMLFDAHEEFRQRLHEIGARVEAGAADDAERAILAFIDGFALHEAAEERLLRAIDDELSAALAGSR